MRRTSFRSARPTLSALVLALAPLAALSVSPGAQFARAPQELLPGIQSAGSRLAVDSDGDLSAAVWVDEILLEVYCSVSDGRGVDWSAPLRVDDPPHTGSVFPVTFLDSTAVVVSGQSIYVTWRELDFASGAGRVLFARSTNGGASFEPEMELDDGVPGLATSPRAVTAVSPDPAGDHIYVLRYDSGPSFGLLAPRVVASHDGGQTFGAAVPITLTTPTGFPSRDPNLTVDGFEARVVWAEDTNSTDAFELYYQESLDGGLTWLDDDVLVSSGLDQLSIESEATLAARDDTLFVPYVAVSPVTGSEELRYSLSTDRGQTWLRGLTLVSLPVGAEVSGPGAHVTPSGRLVVSWEDTGSGLPEVYVSSSPGGTSFSTPTSLWDASGAGGAEVRIEGPDALGDEPTLVIAFDGGTGLSSGSGGTLPAFVSTDDGLSFGPSVSLDALGDGDVDYAELAYNALYENYLAVWRATGSGTESVRVGGLRAQTVQANGAVSGGTGRFDFENFAAPGSDTVFVWALASDSPGTFPLPLMDGRDLGLTFDGSLMTTLGNPTLFSAILAPDGSASTPNFGIAADPGTVFYVAAVSIGLGPARLVELTDVVPITIQ